MGQETIGSTCVCVSAGVGLSVGNGCRHRATDNWCRVEGPTPRNVAPRPQRWWPVDADAGPVRLLFRLIHNGAVMSLSSPQTASVVAVVLVDAVDRVEAVLGEIRKQSLTPTAVFASGGGVSAEAEATRLGMGWVPEAANLKEKLGPDVTHVWFLHDDVGLRPDALSSLHDEAVRVDASVAGSKLLGADGRQLESIGGLTDVFGHPVSSLDEGELDLGQYDVIRDVAYVPSASLLVRRDLFLGLGGIDRMLAPESAGVDFAQRARVAGGRVVVVPSSEVVHSGACREGVSAWREIAGQLRSLLKAYSAVSLIWVLPAAALVGIVVGIASLLTGKPGRTLDYLKAAAWNVKNARSLWVGRRQLRAARQLGDEELFRYQVRGSAAFTEVWADVVDTLRSPLASSEAVLEWAEERTTGRSATVLGAGVIGWLGAVRLVLFEGLPVVGWTLPLAANWEGVLASFAGGWNPTGFGSDGPPHPAAALLAAMTRFFGESTGRTVTAAAAAFGLLGAYRLLRSLGVGQWSALGGAFVGVLGPAAVLLGEAGNWPGILALGAMPWAIHGVLTPFPQGWMGRTGSLARAGLGAFLMTALVPGAVALPLVVGVLAALLGLGWGAAPRGLLVSLVGLPAVGSWGVWYSVETMSGAGTGPAWSLPLAVSAGLVVLWFASLTGGAWRLGALGGVLLGAGAALARGFLPGREAATAGIVVCAAGLILIVGSAAGQLSAEEGFIRRVGALVAIGALVLALLPVGQVIAGGSSGLAASTTVADRLRYLVARDRQAGERVLILGEGLVGDTRTWQGQPYRVMDPAVSFTMAWQGSRGPLDEALEERLDRFITEPALRAGPLFEDFGLAWIVAPPESALAAALRGRLDVVELSFAETSIFEYASSAPVGESVAGPWLHDGTAWTGPAATRVTLRINPTSRLEISEEGYVGSTGTVTVVPDPLLERAALGWRMAAIVLLVGSLVPRRRR